MVRIWQVDIVNLQLMLDLRLMGVAFCMVFTVIWLQARPSAPGRRVPIAPAAAPCLPLAPACLPACLLACSSHVRSQTGSLFLTAGGMLHILLAFPSAYVGCRRFPYQDCHMSPSRTKPRGGLP